MIDGSMVVAVRGLQRAGPGKGEAEGARAEMMGWVQRRRVMSGPTFLQYIVLNKQNAPSGCDSADA